MSALPPVLMILSFQVLIAIVKWVMLHLGRPLNSAAVLSPTMPAVGYVPGMPGLWAPYAQMPSVWQQQAGQNGQSEGSKRQAVESYLASLDPDQLATATRSQVTAELNARGVSVDETYAGRILGEWRVDRPSPNGSRRRGRG